MSLNREEISDRLAAVGYIADRDIATALWLMEFLKRPLLLEGEAGVGKTEVAKALAAVHGAELIRLQCYEGLDQNAALYEWNYQRQLLAIKTREGVGENADAIEEHIFSEQYLLERPLLAAIRREKPPVLLIDEVDRADEEFEAFLLELLSDFQVSIPELGTIKATSIPRVVLTSNGTRELSDALRRRCLYHYVDFPDVDREAQDHPHPHAGHRHRARAADRAHGGGACARRICARCRASRRRSIGRRRSPGLDVHDLRQEPEAVHETMMCLLKTHEDRARLTREVTRAAARQGGVRRRARRRCQSTADQHYSWTRIGRADAPPLGRLARTLRDNGFKVGLAETRDALAILASPAATRPSSLKPALRALFCATHSDWERFDEIFDAYLAAGAACGSGTHACGRAARQSAARRRGVWRRRRYREQALGLPDHVERRTDGGDESRRTDAAAAKAPRAPKVWPTTDLRHIVDPDDVARGARAGGAACAHDARAAGSPRAGAPARPAPRSAPHHSPQCLARRHA